MCKTGRTKTKHHQNCDKHSEPCLKHETKHGPAAPDCQSDACPQLFGARATATLPVANMAAIGEAMVIVARVQMGWAPRIGIRVGNVSSFVSHGSFRLNRNPILAA